MSQVLDKKRVVCAMSGGVDSSVAALLLKEQGYEVIGVTLKLWDPPQGTTFKHTTCCSVEDITDARRVADQVGIPFYVFNSKTPFKEQVVNRFVDEYLKGRTPNPCAMCNDKVKFSYLLEKAYELGAYYVATGHFARKAWNETQNHWELYCGDDPKKDQSYFLFSLNQEQLEHTLFPVGEMTKEQVRALATEHGLKTRAKPESQEICFVPQTHGAFIEKYAPDKIGPEGDFVDEQGQTLGRHKGIHHYTVGQRRGTEVAEGQRLYVKSIDPKTQKIVMGPDATLWGNGLMAKGVRWVRPVMSGTQITARIRYRHEGAAAVVHLDATDQVRVEFKEPQRAISPGQAVVFYLGKEVLGGGWIERGAP